MAREASLDHPGDELSLSIREGFSLALLPPFISEVYQREFAVAQNITQGYLAYEKASLPHKVGILLDSIQTQGWHETQKTTAKKNVTKEVHAFGKFNELLKLFDSMFEERMEGSADLAVDLVLTGMRGIPEGPKRTEWMKSVEQAERSVHAYHLIREMRKNIIKPTNFNEETHEYGTSPLVDNDYWRADLVKWLYEQQSLSPDQPELLYEDFVGKIRKFVHKDINMPEHRFDTLYETLQERDPLLLPFLYQLVTGNGDILGEELSERICELSLSPTFVMGLAGDKNPAGFEPGTLEAYRLTTEQPTVNFDLMKKRIEKVGAMGLAIDGQDENFGEERALQFGFTSDLTQIYGEKSLVAKMISTMTQTSTTKNFVGISLTGIEAAEIARELSKWRSDPVVYPQILAVIRRKLATILYDQDGHWFVNAHGYGSKHEAYLTPSYARLSYNARRSENSRKAKLQVDDGGKFIQFSGISDRLKILNLTVMGADNTSLLSQKNIEPRFTKPTNLPGSMERGALEVRVNLDAYGLMRKRNDDETRVLVKMHSMMGQGAIRLAGILWESVRKYAHIVSETPSVGETRKFFKFFQGINALMPLTLSLMASDREDARKIGNTLAYTLAPLLRIDYLISSRMIHYGKAGKSGRAISSPLVHLHKKMFGADWLTLFGETKHIYGKLASHNIKDVMGPFIERARDKITIIAGTHDPVLHGREMIKLLKKKAGKYLEIINVGNKLDKTLSLTSSPKADLIIAELPHYIHVVKTGRDILRKILYETVGKGTYGVQLRK